MIKLSLEDFGPLPRRALDIKLTLPTHHLLAHEICGENITQLTQITAQINFIQTLRCLTLPNPEQISTTILPKRHLPADPMSHRQLKEWRDMTILKLAARPAVSDLHTLIYRQHTLHLLSKLELN